MVPVPNSFNAPFLLEALGLLNIQFCHADNLPKIFVSQDSFPGNLKLASNPVRASGENEVLSSILSLIYSFQSKSSGITVIRPFVKPSSALRSLFKKLLSFLSLILSSLNLVSNLV